jgi:hypothetical protein
MNSRPEVIGRRFLKKRALAMRYGKSSLKTIDRWLAAGILPRPDFSINKIGFWGEDRLDECDRARTVSAAGKAKRLQADQPSEDFGIGDRDDT